MTQRTLVLIATLGSAGLLAAAFLFQFLGWAPCKMCLWQRWPHAAAVVIGLMALNTGGRILPAFGGLAAAATAAIAVFHSGVERKWWDGPSSCTGSGAGLGGLDGSALLPGASDAPALVLCDTFTPFLFSLSMANWNAVASVVLMLIWIQAARTA